MYYELQQKAYENKVKKGFNLTDVGKEIILIVEEFGELCDATIKKNTEETTDAIGDIMIYCLGLSAMFHVNAEDIVDRQLPGLSFDAYIPYLGKEIGLFAKSYRRSNRQPVDTIDKREELISHVGRMIGYCGAMFKTLGVNEQKTLERIIQQNAQRTQQVRI